MSYTLVSPLDSVEAAQKATRYAATAGFLSAAVIVAFVAYGAWASVDPLGGYFNVWSLVDVAVTVGLSYGTLRGNRTAAVGLLGYYLVNQMVMRLMLGAVGGVWLTLLFSAFFARGAWGAFALHRLRQPDPLADRVDAIAGSSEG
jgi:hypothetical protein